MKAPKILPWVARKAGISEELALKLWRRAASDAECLSGQTNTSEYYGLAVERFLALVEEEAGATPQYQLAPTPKLSWVWRHQTRMSLLSLMAAQNAYQFWRNTWENSLRKEQVA
jgi:hypothetical protein